MCTICQSLNPLNPVFEFHEDGVSTEEPITAAGTGTGGDDGSGLPWYTNTQIAEYLTEGYWEDTGRSGRSFDIEAGDTLTVDISGLDAEGQDTAREALQSWTDVSGIVFNILDGTGSGNLASFSEAGDARANTSTTAEMDVNSVFSGTIDNSGDKDWIEIELEAGQTYAITMDGTDNSMTDTVLRVYDANGNQVGYNDDANGSRFSALDFTASQSGTYYVSAEGYGSKTGDYDLTVTEGAGGSVDITFDDESSGAFATSYTSNGVITSANVNVSASWQSYGTYYLQTYIHEIGHALGLGHSGNYNGSANFGNDAHYANDSYQATVMSYFTNGQNSNVSASNVRVLSPMMADIVAIQMLYGVADNVRDGDTTYGTGEEGPSFGGNLAFTLFDSGGIDTIDLASFSQGQRIDLTPGSYSDLNGRTGNMGIAEGVVIENLITGSGDDELIGNSANNMLDGGSGDDMLDGGAGNDMLIGGNGSDEIEGGAGTDTVIYTGEIGDYNLIYDNNTSAGGTLQIRDRNGDLDVLSGIEVLSFADLVSITVSDFLDAVEASFGTSNQEIDLGDVNFSGDSPAVGGEEEPEEEPVVVDEPEEEPEEEPAEPVEDEPEVMIAEDEGGADRLRLHNTSHDQRIDLTPGTYSDIYGNENNLYIRPGDTIEYVLSGSGDDDITGNDADNYLNGGGGDDVIRGGAGNDTLRGSAGDDMLIGGSGTDTASVNGTVSDYALHYDHEASTGGAIQLIHSNGEVDTLEGVELIRFSDNAVIQLADYVEALQDAYGTIGANAAGVTVTLADIDAGLPDADEDDIFRPEDTGGVDRINLRHMTEDSRIDLASGATSDLDGGTGNMVIGANDVIEQVFSGSGNDQISGNSAGNFLWAGGGDDVLYGLGGNDSLNGSAGQDMIDGGAGNDRLIGGRGNDTLTGGDGADTFIFRPSFGNDVITDWDGAEGDVIDLTRMTEVTSFTDLMNNHATDIGTDVLITIGTQSIVLEDTAFGSLSADQFLF